MKNGGALDVLMLGILGVGIFDFTEIHGGE
jgi:hypothetical protein